MSSATDQVSAEQRFRQAFERLKVDEPKVLPKGTPVSQNNVAKEAGCDPSALRKARFPSLVREIQAYVELHKDDRPSKRQAVLKAREARRDLKDKLAEVECQRDVAQSRLASANRRIVELTMEVKLLRLRLDELQPPPTQLRR